MSRITPVLETIPTGHFAAGVTSCSRCGHYFTVGTYRAQQHRKTCK